MRLSGAQYVTYVLRYKVKRKQTRDMVVVAVVSVVVVVVIVVVVVVVPCAENK